VEKKKAMAARPFFSPSSGYRLTLFNKFFSGTKNYCDYHQSSENKLGWMATGEPWW
jgi:hypothetical protein